MKKTIVTFGLISGVISSLMMVSTMLFFNEIGYDRGLVVGYTAIVLSFLLVYFGIRSYRDNVGNGQISFTKGFAVGIGITLISCVFYVVSWEVLYYNFLPGFWDHFGAHAVEKLRASGAGDAAIAKQLQQVKEYKEMYANPFLNAAMTFIEPFPVGLVITLISAAILRKKPQAQSASPVAAA